MPRLIFFSKLFSWFCLRQIAHHRLRALTVLVGIALGAAVFTSVRLSVRASLDAFTHSVDLITGKADGVVSRPGGRVAEETLRTLLDLPSVAAFSPFSSVYVRGDQQDAASFLLIGIDPLLDRTFRDWKAAADVKDAARAWTDLIAEPFSLLIGRELAQEYNWSVGEVVVLVHARQTSAFKILAILDTGGLAAADGGLLAITDISTFQEFSHTVGRLDRVDLRMAPSSGAADLESLQKMLPPGVRASPASTARESGLGMIRAYQLNLTVLSFSSLFVGMFLVYSLVALNAASRRGEIAILRSVGASKGSIFLLFLAEGGIYGLAGWLLAIPVGGLLTRHLLEGVSRTISTLFVRIVVSDLYLSPWEIVLSLLITVGVSLLAALHPAKEAMSVSPAEAMRPLSREGGRAAAPGRLAAAGVLCVFAAAPLSLLPGVDGVPIAGYVCILLLFAGFSLMAPWAIRSLGQGLAPLLHRLGGIPAFLAGRNVRDTGARIAISVGALITAVSLYCALVIMIHSFRHTVYLWVDQTVSGDLFLTTRNAEINQVWEPFSESDMQAFSELAKELGVDLVPSRRFASVYGQWPYQFDFVDLEAFSRHGRFVWLDGDPQQVMPALTRGEGVACSEVFANRTGLRTGDVFRAEINGVRLERPILGMVRDYRTRGGVVFGSIHGLGNMFGGIPWGGTRFFFKTAPQDLEAAVAALRQKILDRFGDRFDMISGRNLRDSVFRIFDETFAVTGILLLIALAVAALGITTTMTVLVLERIRQLNTILAVGGSPGQVRRMILWETVLMVLAGQVAGLLCGFALSYLLVFVINRQSFGWSFLYSVDWGAIALSLPLILLTALAAALPAVGVAFRQSPALLLREK